MFVQDIKSPGINITAELTESEVDNFRAICRLFLSANLLDQSIDVYILKLSQIRPTTPATSVNHNLSPPCSTHKTSEELAHNENIHAGAHSTLNNNNGEKLQDIVQIDDVIKATRIEMHEILTRPPSRIDSEEEIIEQFSFLLETFHPDINVAPFGSVTFGGFGGQKTDFNILITAGKAKLISNYSVHTLIQLKY